MFAMALKSIKLDLLVPAETLYFHDIKQSFEYDWFVRIVSYLALLLFMLQSLLGRSSVKYCLPQKVPTTFSFKLNQDFSNKVILFRTHCIM